MFISVGAIGRIATCNIRQKARISRIVIFGHYDLIRRLQIYNTAQITLYTGDRYAQDKISNDLTAFYPKFLFLLTLSKFFLLQIQRNNFYLKITKKFKKAKQFKLYNTFYVFKYSNVIYRSKAHEKTLKYDSRGNQLLKKLMALVRRFAILTRNA